MNLPPPPNLTVTLSQQFEIAKIMKACKEADKEQLLLVVESQLTQMAMYKNTITQLLHKWPNEQSKS
jgi:hypothetical protein